MKEYKGIIFDLDGTLLDTVEDIGDSMNQALDKMGKRTYGYDEYRKMVGGGFAGLARNVLGATADPDSIGTLVELFSQAYDGNYMKKSRPYEGIEDLVLQLDRLGIKLAINSNKKDAYTKALVQKFFGHIPLVRVLGDRQGLPIKPDPYSALEIAGAMGLEPGQILYVGDSDVDMKTARNAGMDSIGVAWGFRGREELEAQGASYLVDRPGQILEIIGGIWGEDRIFSEGFLII